MSQSAATENLGTLTYSRHKTLLTTRNPFEQRFRYHRAVRRGPAIFVSGTTALKLGTNHGSDQVEFPGDAYQQAKLSMQRCLSAVDGLGGKLEDVVRVKMFVARGEDCESVGQALRECFGGPEQELEPTTATDSSTNDIVGVSATMIVVPGGFVDGGILVEVEVDAYCA